MRRTYREALAASDAVLLQALAHPDPTYRYGAAKAISKRPALAIQSIDAIIELLADENANVQQAARTSLCLLALQRTHRFEDFGPLPGAAPNQVQIARTQWGIWWQQITR